MEHESSSFCYIDDDGNELPACEESSALAALGIVFDDDGQQCVAPSGHEQPYHEDPEVFERERAAAWKRLEAASAAPPKPEEHLPPSGATADDVTECARINGLADEELVEEEEVQDEEEGMGEYMFSREATRSDEDWVLNRILERRTIRSKKGDSDYKEFYDDFGEKKTGMLAAGRVEYLCEWKGYVEPTWETKELLEDEGFMREVKAFDEAALRHLNTPVAPKWSDLSSKEQEACAGRQFTGGDGEGPVLKGTIKASKVPPVFRYFEDTNLIESLASSNLLGDVAAKVKSAGLGFLQYGSIMTAPRSKAFLETAKRLSATHRPVILFHGTQLKNIPLIAETGLQVPGTGDVAVVNGSAHGVGIYAATCPTTSVYYCKSNSANLRMLVCVGLVSNNDKDITVREGFVVFHRAELVTALWAIDLLQGGIYNLPVHVAYKPASLAVGLGCNDQSLQANRVHRQREHYLNAKQSAALTMVTKRNIADLLRVAEKLRKEETAQKST